MTSQKINIKITQQKNQDFYNIPKNTIITLDFEEYLLGCVAAEIGEAPLEAAKAQAIAARTYAWRTAKKGGYLGDTGASGQAFQAARIENKSYSTTHQGVRETAGIILTYKNKVADTFFSASNGGRTVSSKERWGGERDYLIAQDDPYDVGLKKGHGVGMSQRGATARAKAGQSYKDILDFYYPGTVLAQNYGLAPEQISGDKMTNEQKVVEWAKTQIGNGYVWGATGQKLTQAGLNALIARYPDHVSQAKNGKWIGKIVWDCATFVRGSFRQVGIQLVSGATSQYTKTKWAIKGPISEMPKDRVCALYKKTKDNPETYGHTGLYLGDGTFIDARGSSYGVIHNKIGSYPWTHYAIPVGLDSNSTSPDTNPPEVINMLYQVKVISTDSSLNFRADTSTKSARLALIPPQTILDVVEETNDEWLKVVYNNETGYVMTKFVRKIDEETDEPDSPKFWYLKLRCNNRQEALAYQELLVKLAAAEAVEE